MEPSYEETKHALLHLERVKGVLRKPFYDAANEIISRFDETGMISDYEYQLATNLVMMGYER